MLHIVDVQDHVVRNIPAGTIMSDIGCSLQKIGNRLGNSGSEAVPASSGHSAGDERQVLMKRDG